jgi:tol-pal system protein YbgF
MTRAWTPPLQRATPSWWGRLSRVSLAVLMLAGAQAHAGLFEDDEARRAITELRQQRTVDQDAAKAQSEALNAQIDQLKRSLLDMNAQLEQLRADIAKLRGQDEVLARDIAELQRKQKDVQSSIEDRVRKLEPQPITLDGKAFKVDPDEKREFDEAMGRMRAADFAGGAAGMNGLLQRYPGTGYRESAWYWLGNAHYGLRQYKEAIAAFKMLVDASPDHQRSSEALLSIANCFIELKDPDTARKTLGLVISQYPQAEAAQAARDRLATLPAAPAPAAAAPAAPAAKPRKAK